MTDIEKIKKYIEDKKAILIRTSFSISLDILAGLNYETRDS